MHGAAGMVIPSWAGVCCLLTGRWNRAGWNCRFKILPVQQLLSGYRHCEEFLALVNQALSHLDDNGHRPRSQISPSNALAHRMGLQSFPMFCRRGLVAHHLECT